MIVAITGTPGTGKTAIAKAAARRLRWLYLSLNELAEEKRLYKSYDQDRKCMVVDIGALRAEISRLGLKHRDMLLDAHYAHEMPCDFVIVLRTEPRILRERMEKKGFWASKIEENMEAEIMDVVKEEALSSGKNVYEIDTTKTTPAQAASRIVDMIRSEAILTRDVRIPEKLLPEFRKPHGKVMRGNWKAIVSEAVKEAVLPGGKRSLIIAVGDHCSYNLIESGLNPNMIIIDGMEKRQKFDREIRFDEPEVSVRNPAGGITLELWKAIENIMPDLENGINRKVIVEGEEDLAVLPCMVFAPSGTIIFYGLIDRLVMINLTEKKRAEAKVLLKKIVEGQKPGPRKRRAKR
jgi:broad-specificity NMP kinase/uncharacterized protein (UPF0218 family)